MRGRWIRAAIAGTAVAAGAPMASAQVLGAVGDSLTDEYFEDAYGYSYNWPMHLVLARQLDFGPTAAAASQPNSTWGEPRRTGYRHNWARSGATSATMLSQGQHTGLAMQAAAHGVTHAVVWIGANDFHFGVSGAYQAIYSNSWTPQQIEEHILASEANIEAAVQALRSAGLGVVLLNVPDYGYAPLIRTLYPSAEGRQRVSNAIVTLNIRLRTLAAHQDVMLVDTFSLMQAVFGSHQQPFETLLLGNVPINLRQADTFTNSRPAAAFVHDGVHPHTTLQGVVSNLVITALNMGFDAGIAPLSEEEILDRAGLQYGGQDTLTLYIGDYRDYIFNYACYANCDRSTTSPILNVDDFLCFIDKFSQGDPEANCTGSTTQPMLTIDDFLCFIDRFAAGCS